MSDYGLGLRARLRRTAEPPTSASAEVHQADRVRDESSAYAVAAGLRFPCHSNGKFVFFFGVKYLGRNSDIFGSNQYKL